MLFALPFISRRVVRRLATVVSETVLGPCLSLRGILNLPLVWGDQRNTDRKHGKYLAFPESQCALCAENAVLKLHQPELGFLEPPSDKLEEYPSYPIYNPYQTSCGHVYCYHCLAEKIMQTADEAETKLSWECLRCGVAVKEIHRYIVEVSESEISESDYDFSSDLDLGTDLSGSVYTYSESE